MRLLKSTFCFRFRFMSIVLEESVVTLYPAILRSGISENTQALLSKRKICYNEVIFIGRRERRQFTSSVLSRQHGPSFLRFGSAFLITITKNEKGQVETLQEHQTDASFNTAPPI